MASATASRRIEEADGGWRSRLTLTTLRPNYEVGQQVRVSLRVLDPQLQQQLPEQLRADVIDAATGQLVKQEPLVRQESQQFDAVDRHSEVERYRVGSLRLELVPKTRVVRSDCRVKADLTRCTGNKVG